MTTATSPGPGARLTHALAVSRAQHRAALGLYLPVGYPTRTSSMDALHLMAQHADVLELGLPHTDPHMDGPVIQQAAAQALSGGVTIADLIAAAAELTATTDAALLVMSYWEPIARFGMRAFADELADAGAAGVLVPDLPSADAASWRTAATAAGLHPVALVPPHASAAALAALGVVTSGLAYAPATPGVTGTQGPLTPYLPHLVHRVRTHTGLPVAVGIGISTPQQATETAGYADAVVVGSAVIRHMQARPGAPAAAAAEAASAFAAAVGRAGRPAA